ncbi:hypothetical protein SAMN05216576_107245 [Ectopseudomonas chengduensis]|jgi:hypothetical protein|uniref:Uncharacterized protein n=1 Tax=Ectopseudomonas chengduensis TaxID=489632 RepID=A0A1G6Q446_9GAMM|nr:MULTISPECIES: hypothetical protein [Pseudomonas]MBP3062072.1 hypothetical protein [Pseudomonas chengduensis]NNB75364.1 hypothetical protein [Pseudomonas chengduensis]OEO24387.1 hypothetical protein AX279_17105 [Pseudomonas sp. J237]CRN65986.1 hypothetical protein PAERUG_P40_Scotland_4_VIM_2_09_12_04072 [Pseudomonas aeruginosa]SDC87113.1 hypothetical protein SAMN05216576_107245 [Pseudomonas chengduensis]
MATWIEIRCENRGKVSEEEAAPTKRCYSSDNIGPMDMAEDNRASLLETMRFLEKDARDDGWKKTKEGWVCPFCAKLSSGAQ